MYVERKNFNGVRISDSDESDDEAGEVGLKGRVWELRGSESSRFGDVRKTGVKELSASPALLSLRPRVLRVSSNCSGRYSARLASDSGAPAPADGDAGSRVVQLTER